ncbi:MAG: sensor histidine kinase [Chloroflexi bacterium]|nr:sensor histidine kinase [Chloroflexota bacterium]
MFRSIRWKVALGLALPVLAALIGFSVADYYRRNALLTVMAENSAIQMGEMASGSLRHAMMLNDREMLQQTLIDIGKQKNILRVAIFDENAHLKITDQPADFLPIPTLRSPGCVECHTPSGILDQHSITISLPNSDSDEPMLRSSIQIYNEPACHQCHDPLQSILGVIITDYSLSGFTAQINKDMWIDVAASAGIALTFTLILYFAAHFLIVKRVERLRLPLRRYALGDLSVRIPVNTANDEIDDLINAFNHMADTLEEETQLKELASSARYQAVMEERHRLARELHDSTAQILGYVRNKATAVRMLIEQKKIPDAITELRQLDEAAGNVFADLRQAILDLKTDIGEGRNIGSVLTEYVLSFERYSDIPTEVVNEGAYDIQVPPGSDLQLLRIVQEALSNVRKHSRAMRATVTLQVNDQNMLILIVRDNGTGFDPSDDFAERKPHFGLEIMSERASAIGASFEVISKVGQGTQVVVKLPLKVEGESA